MARGHAMARGVGHRRDVEAKLEAAVEKAAVQSWNCGDGDARGGGAHDGGGAHYSMSGKSDGAAIAGLAQGQYGNRSEYVLANESAYVAAAVVVELYNASAASAVVAVAAAAAAAAAAACATRIPSPSSHFPLSRVHLARTWVRWDARFLSLAPSH